VVANEAAFETIGDPGSPVGLVLTCEHAANALPEWTAEPADLPLLFDHWGFDIGAAALTRWLVAEVGGVAVLSRFSRLVCDPNREPDDPTFVVERIGRRVLSWNRAVDERERRRRRDRYYAPYHAEIDRIIDGRLAAGQPTRLCSIHSFTPQLEGALRPMEIGVLFDDHEALAGRAERALREAGFHTAANEPYSGYAGLIHAARRHGVRHGIVYIELEVRQDLLETPEAAVRVARRMAPAIADFAAAPGDGERAIRGREHGPRS
jgi:predicted N-formylglutamate amidohydrolase